MNDTIIKSEIHPLLQAVMQLLQAQRSAFRQEQTCRRAMGLLFGELFRFSRHTVAQGMLALGITTGGWRASTGCSISCILRRRR